MTFIVRNKVLRCIALHFMSLSDIVSVSTLCIVMRVCIMSRSGCMICWSQKSIMDHYYLSPLILYSGGFYSIVFYALHLLTTLHKIIVHHLIFHYGISWWVHLCNAILSDYPWLSHINTCNTYKWLWSCIRSFAHKTCHDYRSFLFFEGVPLFVRFLEAWPAVEAHLQLCQAFGPWPKWDAQPADVGMDVDDGRMDGTLDENAGNFKVEILDVGSPTLFDWFFLTAQ